MTLKPRSLTFSGLHAVAQGISLHPVSGATREELRQVVDLAMRNWPG